MINPASNDLAKHLLKLFLSDILVSPRQIPC